MVSEITNCMAKVQSWCTVIVGFYVLKFIATFLYNNFLAPALRINAVDLTKTGKWAVVTGATDGIGKAYAEALAKKNLNIVLISRTQAKLDDVAANIKKNYNVETRTIAADFTSSNDIYNDIAKRLKDLDIGILVNNVGMYYPYPEYFLDLKDEVYVNIIRCNIVSAVNMSKIVLPGMVQRRRGVVVNVSSAAAVIPSPLATIYAASKSFVVKFSEDLAAEYKKDGITIQCLIPGYVATNMSRIRSETWTAPFPAKYVEEALTTIGIREKATGYFPHTLVIGAVNLLDSIAPRLTKWLIVKRMYEIRTNVLKRH